MSKIVRYDENGKEVYFDYGIDAREAVASGRFFETPPEGTVAVEAVPEAAKKKGRPAKAEESGVALEVEDAAIAETIIDEVVDAKE